MHLDIMDYLFRTVDYVDWFASDDLSFSVTLVDIDARSWPINDDAPESLKFIPQSHIRRTLADHCDDSRFVVLRWSATGGRAIFGAPSHREAMETLEALLA